MKCLRCNKTAKTKWRRREANLRIIATHCSECDKDDIYFVGCMATIRTLKAALAYFYSVSTEEKDPRFNPYLKKGKYVIEFNKNLAPLLEDGTTIDDLIEASDIPRGPL